MPSTPFRMGEFPIAQTGIFNFAGKDFLSTSRYFGLDLHESWLIMHVRAKSDDRQLHAVRPIMLATSNGVSYSVSREDGVYQDPRGAEFLRGGTFSRTVNADGDLVLSGSSGFWSGATAQTVEARFGATLSWEDSGKIFLKGRLLGPGMQTYISSRHGDASGGICHTGLFYEAEGEVFGEAASGIVILENAFSPPGKVLADSVIRRRYVGGWNGFANVYADGTAQYGHIAYGPGPFRFANILDGDRHICCPIQSIETKTRPNGLGERIDYTFTNGERWEFVTEKNGTLMDMVALAKRLGSSTQAHKGHAAPVGENRPRRNWYSIQEWIPERLKNNAPDFDEDPPKGF